jgi:hypothetical protein
LALDQEVVIATRRLMSSYGGIHRLADFAALAIDEAHDLLEQGRVAAVDGTSAIDPIETTTSTMTAVAVAGVSNRFRGDPQVQIFSVSVQHTPARVLSEVEAFGGLVQAIEDMRSDEGSWLITAREALEREYALERLTPEHEVVLIDGPVFTQNLLTQTQARGDVLERIRASQTRFIGFIKQLDSATCRLIGDALDEGELYTYDQFFQADLAQRFRNGGRRGRIGQDNARDEASRADTVAFAEALFGDRWVRVIYRLRERAFGIECRERDARLAAALVLADPSYRVNHEIPAMLHNADTCVRGRHRGAAARYALIRRVPDLRISTTLRHERDDR